MKIEEKTVKLNAAEAEIKQTKYNITYLHNNTEHNKKMIKKVSNIKL